MAKEEEEHEGARSGKSGRDIDGTHAKLKEENNQFKTNLDVAKTESQRNYNKDIGWTGYA